MKDQRFLANANMSRYLLSSLVTLTCFFFTISGCNPPTAQDKETSTPASTPDKNNPQQSIPQSDGTLSEQGKELSNTEDSAPANPDKDVNPNNELDASSDNIELEPEDSEFPLNKKLTPEEEARLDEAIKKAQEFNIADHQEPELTPQQEAQLKEKQNQANESRSDPDAFMEIASETPGKTLEQRAIENDAVGYQGDYPDSVLDPNSPDYDWKIAVKAKPLPVDLGEPIIDNPDDLVRLHPKQNIWFDKKNKTAVLHGAVGLNRGALELFACTGRVTRDRSFKDRIFADGPKAHESVLVFDIIPHLMHAALLASGAQPGKPAVFSPQFIPPSGTSVEVTLRWKDDKGNVKQANGGDWILDQATQKTLKTPFVFTGSMFMVNRDGKRIYAGDVDGELICVSNFASAVIDVPMESSGNNDDRLFIANEEAIPACGTPVTMILKPIVEKTSSSEPTSQP